MINKSDEIYNQTQITNQQDIWMQQINTEAVDKKQNQLCESLQSKPERNDKHIIQRSYQ